MNKNFRFESIKGKKQYTSATKDALYFGEKDLVITQGFRQCTSEMEGHFTAGGSVYKMGQDPKNILFSANEIRTCKLEVWCLKSFTNMKQ